MHSDKMQQHALGCHVKMEGGIILCNSNVTNKINVYHNASDDKFSF